MTNIFPLTLIYNFAMLAVVIAAIRLMSRRRGFLGWCAAMIFAGAAAGFLGLVCGLFENPGGIIRFWSYAIFLHGTILFAATAVIYRKKKVLAVGAIAVVLAMVSVAIDAFLIEPYRLEVNRYRIATPKISRPVRIVIIADLQTDNIGDYERETLRRAMEEEPDLVLFAGDYIQAFWKDQKRLCGELNELLRIMDIQAPLGAFAVRGNVDPRYWTDIFKDTGVKAVGANRSFDLGELQLTCLGISDSYGTSSVKEAEVYDGRFHIILGHVPNFALGNGDADLIVAGHTHGGQLQLPLLGPVITNSRLPRRMAHGFNDLPGGGKLIVSRGIGMERSYAPRFRLFCRPELVVIELVPEDEGKTNEGE